MYTNPSSLSPEVRALLDRVLPKIIDQKSPAEVLALFDRLPIELLERIKMHQSPKSQKKFRSRFKQAAS